MLMPPYLILQLGLAMTCQFVLQLHVIDLDILLQTLFRDIDQLGGGKLINVGRQPSLTICS
jgi:hypothetical protein